MSAGCMGCSDSGPRSGFEHRRMMQYLRAVALCLALCLLFACASRPPRPRSRVAPSRRPPPGAQLYYGDRGWEYLKTRLVADGVARDLVQRAFDDPRMPPFDGLQLSPSGQRESHFMYRNFLQEGGTQLAIDCRAQWASAFESAERRFGVPASVCAAIITVETHCGRNTGRSMILYRLARLAMAEEPQNLQRNLQRCAPDGDPDTEARVRARARYLNSTFYPEVRATF